jgi:hypothetical protein
MNRRLVYLALVVMAALHHDFWFWNDPTLVFGFLPVGLAYHALYSAVAGLLWYVIMRRAWPDELEKFAQPEREGAFRE